jgi:hypothetical protein
MPQRKNERAVLAFKAVIPATATPIGFSGGEGEAGFIKLQHFATGEEVQQMLDLRGKELIVTMKRA